MRLTTELAFFAALAGALAGCATPAHTWRYAPDRDAIGRLYYYERTNIDGSMDERVTVFRRDADHIEVYKENGLCENAALVTAEMDWATFSAAKITGGALLPEAQHREFAFLTWNRETDTLDIHVRFPDFEIRNDAKIETRPWHLFDFDFASLTVATPHLSSRNADFTFGMPLLWTAPDADDPLVWMGDVEAHYLGVEDHLGVASRRYGLKGSALTGPRSTGEEGTLWLDAKDGHVVDAVLPVPNHDGYADFRLRLLKISDGGETEWTQLLRAHFAGCNA